MGLKEEQFASLRSIIPMHDANHDVIRLARAGKTEFDEALRILDEVDSMDESYKILLYCLLSIEERWDPHKEKNDEDDFTEHEKKSEALKKRKNKQVTSKHDDDYCNAEEQIDPQYELFLKHLKAHDKSYVVEYEKDCLPVVIKYEGRMDSDREGGDPEPERTRKKDRARNVVNEKIPKKEDRRMLIGVSKHKRGTSNQTRGVEIRQKQYVCGVENQWPNSVKMTKSLTCRKSRSEAQNARIGKCSASEFREVMAEKCHMEESDPEKHAKGKSDSDVEILDEAAYQRKGILSPFVSSKKFAKSMEEGRPSACDEFRKVVLNALKKPYNREEYTRLLETIRDGRYLECHPDLERKLTKYRYNRRKRLAILRGFFFWLQNLTREGAFKPWKDRTCLAVEPPSP